MIRIMNSSTHHVGFQVLLKFYITQHSRDEELIRSLVTYLNCGGITFYEENQSIHFVVTKFSDFTDKIIPFFDKYPIIGEKSKDFEDFCKAAELMKAKEHLTSEGIKKLTQIKNGMNKKRINSTNLPTGKRFMSTTILKYNPYIETNTKINFYNLINQANLYFSSILLHERNLTLLNRIHLSDLKPSFVSGLLDAEGSLVVLVLQDSRLNIKWRLVTRVQIKLHKIDTD